MEQKPNNYIFVTNFPEDTDINILMNILKQFGEIKNFEIIKDLSGKNCALEVYFENSHSSNLAERYLNNKVYEDFYLHIKTSKNFEEEEIENKTLILSNLNQSLTHESLLNELEKYGHVMKLEMPLVNRTPSLDKQGQIFNLADNYLNILIGSIEKNENNILNTKEIISEKSKINFYFSYLNKVIEKFKDTLYNNSNSIPTETQFNILSNLLLEINFFLRKFFPDTIINSIIKQEYDELATKIRSGKFIIIILLILFLFIIYLI